MQDIGHNSSHASSTHVGLLFHLVALNYVCENKKNWGLSKHAWCFKGFINQQGIQGFQGFYQGSDYPEISFVICGSPPGVNDG